MKALLPIWLLVLVTAAASAQVTVCPSAPVYEPCEIEIRLSDADAAAHPDPFVSVELRAEFRSPKGGATKVMRAFWDGGYTFRMRFSPDFEGRWDLRLISNIESLDHKIFSFDAGPARTPGFIRAFNSRYFRYDAPESPHYWMGFTDYGFATRPWDEFKRIVDERAAQKFNHLRGLALGEAGAIDAAWPTADGPAPSHFQELDRRIEYLNSKGIIADLLLGDRDDQLATLLPERDQRQRFARYLVARYAAYNVTWQGVREFETYEDGRGLLREIMGAVKEFDPYDHPRSTHAAETSSPLIQDGWMTYITHQGSSGGLAVIDYETHLMPVVNTGDEQATDAQAARRGMWRVAARGSYPTLPPSAGGAASAATHLYNFFTQTRYMDLQPYYRLTGGAAMSLQYIDGWDEAQGVEYVVYVEEPAPVDLLVPDNGYDVSWFDPTDGAWYDQKKKFKGDRFRGSPPDEGHDWVLYVRREGRKEKFNKRYYLEARRVVPKEVETRPSELPFEIQLPDEQRLTAGQVYDFNATLTKSTQAAKQMSWLWIAEVSASGRSPRVLGSEQFGRFQVPTTLTDRYPATFSVRLLGIDGAGRLFEGFKAYTLERPAGEQP